MRLEVLFAEGPHGTDRVNVYIDGKRRAQLDARDTTWIGESTPRPGRHSVTVEAVDRRGRVLLRRSAAFTTLDPKNPRFIAYAQNAWRSWGEDDD
jgi:hypothetical protein